MEHLMRGEALPGGPFPYEAAFSNYDSDFVGLGAQEQGDWNSSFEPEHFENKKAAINNCI